RHGAAEGAVRAELHAHAALQPVRLRAVHVVVGELVAHDTDRQPAPLARERDLPSHAREASNQATGASPITFMRRPSAFMANSRVSSMLTPKRSMPSSYQGGVSTPSAAGPHSTSVRWIA